MTETLRWTNRQQAVAIDHIDPPPSGIRWPLLAVDEAGFAQTSAEGVRKGCVRFGRRLIEKSDHRKRRLLRARRQRPRE